MPKFWKHIWECAWRTCWLLFCQKENWNYLGARWPQGTRDFEMLLGWPPISIGGGTYAWGWPSVVGSVWQARGGPPQNFIDNLVPSGAGPQSYWEDTTSPGSTSRGSFYLAAYLPSCLLIYLSICLFLYLSLCLPLRLPIYLSFFLFVFLSTCLLSKCLSVYLSIHLSIDLSICLSGGLPFFFVLWLIRRNSFRAASFYGL